MTLLMGALFAAGLLLCVSPWLWPPREKALPEPSAAGAGVRLLEEAGFSGVRPRTLMVVMAAIAVVSASVVWLLTGLAALALVAAVAAASAPVAFLRGRRLRLRRARRQLWPDVCDLLIAAIRVGLSLPDAVASLSESAPQTVRSAFAVFARDLQATGRFETIV
jgi:tight adherence protein B